MWSGSYRRWAIVSYICKSAGESFLPDPDLVIAGDETLELQSAHLYLCDFFIFLFPIIFVVKLAL